MNKRIKDEHDLGYKHILSSKKNFLQFLKGFVKKDWVALIKEDNLILIDKEFILKDFKEEEADIVYRVNIDGNDIIFYVLLEFQSKVDFSMPIRLLMYMTEIWRDELKNTDDKTKKKKDYRLPAIVPMVVYNGKHNWTAVRNFKHILKGQELFEDNVVDFRYLLFDVNRMEKEELLEIANIVSAVFLLDQNVNDIEIVDRLKLVGRILRKDSSKEQQKIFKAWLVNILRNRFKDNIDTNINKLLKETSELEVEDMVSNLGKTIERGFKTSEQRGIEKGKEETAVNLLKLGIAEEIIAKGTGLSLEKILKLKKKFAN
ncbi:putative transposase [Clostridium pasteurianum DSM 525 = ATCC 6013]|uniref:Putative transposase n=1 Tax=Clostridium pasteurianum DSM 525 = ATCC 6013 TaxID=1262449 RepID=A0A0H3J217_CLOPA|nr:Rpn family recombination-promoting nuclease/putative transposase [Clostridium pasteurianum]AJA46777.1 putative transposase [Clostridium pasteurianum DSM 525 = ATCC 6013]AJA50765.1 putative transposase [Clostridium pasteurianum DSM 525 = ATCC 6013]AOZ74170.1 transposase [Clostridium pasteurianum DSM 525 = ATCC 6013]AOZ77968.1 transposase [Clostridium pasteurianum]ELP58613.1 putative transposase [Clostridium pasteurianum DSM 525 = ATCC 6013]